MLDKIKKMADFIAASIREAKKTREEKFTAFHEFHKWLLENIDPAVCAAVGNIQGVSGNRWGLEISTKDYQWWAEKYASGEDLNLKPLDEIKRMVFGRIMEVAKTCTPQTKESIQATIALIDDVYLGK